MKKRPRKKGSKTLTTGFGSSGALAQVGALFFCTEQLLMTRFKRVLAPVLLQLLLALLSACPLTRSGLLHVPGRLACRRNCGKRNPASRGIPRRECRRRPLAQLSVLRPTAW